MKCAVVRICCGRADGVEYFDDYETAAAWRSDYENSYGSGEFEHQRTGVLLGIDRREASPPMVGLEDHQHWIWMGERWEVRGTGALWDERWGDRRV